MYEYKNQWIFGQSEKKNHEMILYQQEIDLFLKKSQYCLEGGEIKEKKKQVQKDRKKEDFQC